MTITIYYIVFKSDVLIAVKSRIHPEILDSEEVGGKDCTN